MNEPSSASGTESPRIDLALSILDCVADLERAGFPRPASLSPDAYLAALGELDDRWSTDARRLSGAYAELRFGASARGSKSEIENEPEREELLHACRRLALAATSDGTNEESVSPSAMTLAEAWRGRWTDRIDEATAVKTPAPPAFEVEPSPTISARAAGSSADSLVARAPTAKSRGSRRFFSKPRPAQSGVRVWNFAALALAAMILAGLGGSFLGNPWNLQSLLAGGEYSQIDFSNGPIVMLSEPLRGDGGGSKPDVGLPKMFPSHYPHADRFNGTIAGSWLELAELYCTVGRCDRADAIYNYVAKALPRDATVQTAYASFLLTAPDLRYRDPERALEFAEYGYSLDPDSDRAVETLTAALYATGDVARAVAIQQERLQRVQRPDFAGIPFDRIGDRGAG